ncbi:hypothetical protein [Bacillus sp. UMB0728]|uniref:hypothetical protein n=1 Tax=Bacillus sp. UMB0728 TaxID=2066052 RepID=UPI000C773147|nr:hypothetical protein [Bacillus sp. UMB0728]PLR72252.1 hypothetical protein CYJ37_11900 [Bacillus sp. UMB0728]
MKQRIMELESQLDHERAKVKFQNKAMALFNSMNTIQTDSLRAILEIIKEKTEQQYSLASREQNVEIFDLLSKLYLSLPDEQKLNEINEELREMYS